MKKLIYISIGLILMVMNPLTLDAQPDTTRWSPELALQYESLSNAQISPDGEHLAYVAEEAIMDETTSKFQGHIYVAASDGSSDIQYTRGDHSNMNPKMVARRQPYCLSQHARRRSSSLCDAPAWRGGLCHNRF